MFTNAVQSCTENHAFQYPSHASRSAGCVHCGRLHLRKGFITAISMAWNAVWLCLFPGAALFLASQTACAQRTATEPPEHAIWKDPGQPVQARVEDLVSRMTLAEKIGQMNQGAAELKRLAIPAYNWRGECDHGVAYAGAATVFPQSIALAATWNTDLVHRVAVAISDEARAKHHYSARKGDQGDYRALTFMSPNLSILRDPRWGGCQETYGEDPFVVSRMGVAFVKGIQGEDGLVWKTVAVPKHLAPYSGPTAGFNSLDCQVSLKDLFETYLPPLEACVREAKAHGILCGSCALNGQPCSINPLLLNTLRKKWGFDGFVVAGHKAMVNMSTALKSAISMEDAAAKTLEAGCDLAFGPDRYGPLSMSVEHGHTRTEDIDAALKRVLYARFRLGMFDPPEKVVYASIPYSVIDCAEHRRLARQAARESIVLLKNTSHVLPLKKDIRTIAVIGPNADTTETMLGTFAGKPSFTVTPLEGIRNAVSSETKVLYAKGGSISEEPEFVPVPQLCLVPAKDSTSTCGLSASFFNNTEFGGAPVAKRTDSQVDFDWGFSSPCKQVKQDDFSARWQGELVPPVNGRYTFALRADDAARLLIGGKPLVDMWQNAAPVDLTTASMALEAGRKYSIAVEYVEKKGPARVSLLWSPPCDPTPDLQEAAEKARQADASVLILGTSLLLEGRARDRNSIGLEPIQQRLAQMVIAAGKPVIVVLMNGGPVALNETGTGASAILETWIAGEEGGNALADVLFGDHSPGAKLPVTVYGSVEQLPPFEDYAIATGRTYRYCEKQPEYRFGYGLSYTSFQYRNLTVSPQQIRPDQEMEVSVQVKNAGKVESDEVAQVYVSHRRQATPEIRDGGPWCPIRELAGFQRIRLAAGEERQVVFRLPAKALSCVDNEGHRFIQPGSVKITVGGGQPGGKGAAEEAVEAPLTVSAEIVSDIIYYLD